MNERPLSPTSEFEEFGAQLAGLTDTDLATWMEDFLSGRGRPPLPPSLPLEPFEVVQRLCVSPRILGVRPKIERALISLLHSVDNPRGKERLLLGLLLLAVVLRPHACRPALRRLLYSGVARGSVVGRIQLTNELITANCKYGVDERLHEFITSKVPTFRESEFRTYALACFRGLLYAYDERPFWFIPHLSRFFDDEQFFGKFCYLLRVGIRKSGISAFSDCYEGVVAAMGVAERRKINEFLCSAVFYENDADIANPHYVRMYLRVRAALIQRPDLDFLLKFASSLIPLPTQTKKQILAEFWMAFCAGRERVGSQGLTPVAPYYLQRPNPTISGTKETILYGRNPDGSEFVRTVDEGTADLFEEPGEADEDRNSMSRIGDLAR